MVAQPKADSAIWCGIALPCQQAKEKQGRSFLVTPYGEFA